MDIGLADSTLAGIITATATVITALGGLLMALTVLVPILRSSKRTETEVGKVHTIVNQQRTDQERYNIALVELLKKHDIEVPVDQSKPVIGQPDATPHPGP
jgi:hypothetical protein